MHDRQTLLRALPQVQRLLELPTARALTEDFGHAAVTDAIRLTLDSVRRSIEAGGAAPCDSDDILRGAEHLLHERQRIGLRRVINATGIILHTNLGRAPMAPQAIAAVQAVAAGYCNLEYDIASGKRGSRTASLEPLLAQIVGAQGSLAVNNGAAAVLLALSGLANGGEVLVSRGELVEIGGGFRIPDVIRQGGARLVEVGATNKTRLADYAAAITPETRVLLKVHQSNFRTIGFTEETSISDLAQLARDHAARTGQQLLVVADLGSGLLTRHARLSEPTIAEALAQGADIVTCSGDKLLGGPQAGLILGTAAAIDPLRKHPLMRAIRLDKMTLAALEATLLLHRDRPDAVPVHAMLAQSRATIRARAERLHAMLGHAGERGMVRGTAAYAGGGALPEEKIDSYAVVLECPDGAETVAERLRLGAMPVVGRIEGGCLLLDMLTVRDEDVADLAEAVQSVLQ